jgi:hypothetical protein
MVNGGLLAALFGAGAASKGILNGRLVGGEFGGRGDRLSRMLTLFLLA